MTGIRDFYSGLMEKDPRLSIFKGADIDIEQGRKNGETSPTEFWARVWNEIHSSGGGPPDNLPTKKLKTKWNKMRTSGMSSDEIWERMEREYPGPFLVGPLELRFYRLGKNVPVEKMRMFDAIANCTYSMLKRGHGTEQLRQKFENLTSREQFEEFLEENWDDIHAMKNFKAIFYQCNGHDGISTISKIRFRKFKLNMFPHVLTDKSGKLIKKIPGYQTSYPMRFANVKLFFETTVAIYNEFDFC